MEKSINVLSKIASALNRRDEVPNQELAKIIVTLQNKEAIQELIQNLGHTDKAIQNDCIKVLYEIGMITPDLITDYFDTFLELLDNKNNRLQWGGMIALNTIVHLNADKTYNNLPYIIKSAEKGSVITRDHAVNIIISLAKTKNYEKDAFSLLMEQLLKSPTNQFPMYAERSIPLINENNKRDYLKILNERLPDIEKESKKKRVEKIVKRFT